MLGCCKLTYLYALKHTGLQMRPLRCHSYFTNVSRVLRTQLAISLHYCSLLLNTFE